MVNTAIVTPHGKRYPAPVAGCYHRVAEFLYRFRQRSVSNCGNVHHRMVNMWVTSEVVECADSSLDHTDTGTDVAVEHTSVVGGLGSTTDVEYSEDSGAPGSGSGGGIPTDPLYNGWTGSVRVVIPADPNGELAGAVGYSNGTPPNGNIIYVDYALWEIWKATHPEVAQVSTGVVHQPQPSRVGDAYYDGYVFNPDNPAHMAMLAELQNMGVIVYKDYELKLQSGSTEDTVIGTEGYMEIPDVNGSNIPL